MTYPNGVNTVYQYDNLNRLTNLAATHTASGTPITNFGYQYDAAGNRTQKSTLDFTEDYKYDPLYRLTRAERTNPGATPPNQWTWNYDQVGNRTSAQKDSEATTSSYNEKNQLTGSTGGGKMLWRGTLDEPGIVSFSGATINGQPARMLAGNVFEATLDLPAGANNVTIQAQDGSGNVATKVYSVNVIGVPSSYTYDANGNLSAKTEGADSWTYTWNGLNELIAVSKNGVTQASYGYDPKGRRVERAAGSTTTTWSYDGDKIVRQSATTSAVTTATRFIHGPGTDQPLADENVATSASTYLHADALGSIVRHTDAAAAVTNTITYDAWGKILGGAPASYGFTAREWDPSIGLSYYRARWYDQNQGRFVGEDPIGFNGGINFFAYVANMPTIGTDPSGLLLKLCTRSAWDGPIFNHAYYYNDGPAPGAKDGANCGRGPMSGHEKGPGTPGVTCVDLPGTEGKEAAILNCCHHKSAPLWVRNGKTVINMIPFVNDCHNVVNDCLANFNVDNPGAPGGRMGCRNCGPVNSPGPPPTPSSGPTPNPQI